MPSTPTTDPYSGLNSSFAAQLHQLVSAVNNAGGKLSLGSGLRTRDEQQQLYNNAVSKYGQANAANWAAVPGTSNHELGLALDLQGDPHSLQMAHDMASQYNLNFPLNNEPWHVEPVGIRQNHDNQGGPPATYGNNTSDSMFNRANMLMQAITGQTASVPPGDTTTVPRPTAATAAAVPSTTTPTNTSLSGVGSSSGYDALFAQVGQKYGINPRLLKAVANQESGFNPNAKSGAGAVGLMQFMPGTASGLGINPLDPNQAVDGAGKLLSGYIKQFGSVDKALAAYNAGPGAVAKYNGVPPFAETRNYVSSIMSQVGAS